MAIRGLKMRKRHNPQVYTHLIELISKLRHGHLVSALGHCLELHPDDSSVSRLFLISEFVPNGTLRGCISGKVALINIYIVYALRTSDNKWYFIVISWRHKECVLTLYMLNASIRCQLTFHSIIYHIL